MIHYCLKCIDTLCVDGQQKLTKNYDHISQGDWRSLCKMSAFYGEFEWSFHRNFKFSYSEELHSSHLRIVRMKALSRRHFWWPGIDRSIEEVAKRCTACQRLSRDPGMVTLHPWVWPDTTFQRIHVDFAGPFLEKNFFLVVDANSKWMEVIPMSRTTTEATIQALRDLFARYGIPEILVSDNGPQFTSVEFKEFLIRMGVKHLKSAPYHPKLMVWWRVCPNI